MAVSWLNRQKHPVWPATNATVPHSGLFSFNDSSGRLSPSSPTLPSRIGSNSGLSKSILPPLGNSKVQPLNKEPKDVKKNADVQISFVNESNPNLSVSLSSIEPFSRPINQENNARSESDSLLVKPSSISPAVDSMESSPNSSVLADPFGSSRPHSSTSTNQCSTHRDESTFSDPTNMGNIPISSNYSRRKANVHDRPYVSTNPLTSFNPLVSSHIPNQLPQTVIYTTWPAIQPILPQFQQLMALVPAYSFIYPQEMLARIDRCSLEYHRLETARKKTEAELAKQNLGKQISSNNRAVPRQVQCPSRLDRLIFDFSRELARIITLREKMKQLRGYEFPMVICKIMSDFQNTLESLRVLRMKERDEIAKGLMSSVICEEIFTLLGTAEISSLKTRAANWCALMWVLGNASAEETISRIASANFHEEPPDIDMTLPILNSTSTRE